jgi:hypothetical protein
MAIRRDRNVDICMHVLQTMHIYVCTINCVYKMRTPNKYVYKCVLVYSYTRVRIRLKLMTNKNEPCIINRSLDQNQIDKKGQVKEDGRSEGEVCCCIGRSGRWND